MSKSTLPDHVTHLAFESYREQFEAGDHHAVLRAISFAAQWHVAMPDWLATAYIKAFHRFLNVETRTLCEAFGVQRPKGFNMAAARKRRKKGYITYWRVRELHEAGEPLTVALFQRVAEEEHVNRDWVSDRYYYWKKLEEPGET